MQREPSRSAERRGDSTPWWGRISGRDRSPHELGAPSFNRGRHPVRGCRGGRVFGPSEASTQFRSVTSAVSAPLVDRGLLDPKAKLCADRGGQSEDTFLTN